MAEISVVDKLRSGVLSLRELAKKHGDDYACIYTWNKDYYKLNNESRSANKG